MKKSNLELVSPDELSRHINAFGGELWNRCFDGLFYGEHHGKMPGLNFEGAAIKVIAAHVDYARRCNILSSLFPFSIGTRWNSENRTSISCSFMLEYDPAKGIGVAHMDIRHFDNNGGLISERQIFPAPGCRIPGKKTVVLMTISRKENRERSKRPKM